MLPGWGAPDENEAAGLPCAGSDRVFGDVRIFGFLYLLRKDIEIIENIEL